MLHIVCLIIIIIIFILWKYSNKKVEGYNDQTGRYCLSCRNRTKNQCTRCFNCGYAADRSGKGVCIGGDHKGPFNYEKVTRWYHGDPFSYMLQRDLPIYQNDYCLLK